MNISFTNAATVAVSASQMDSTIRYGYNAIASLKSCREWERPNESRRLRRCFDELVSYRLKRKNAILEERKISLLNYLVSIETTE